MSEIHWAMLSGREKQVVKFAADGLTDAAIALKLGIRETTVKTYWHRMRTKFGRQSRTEMVAMILRAELQRTAAALKAEKMRHESHGPFDAKLYRVFIEEAPDAILIVTKDGHILMANEFAVELLGYSRDELQSRSIAALVPKRFGHAHKVHLAEYMDDPTWREMGKHVNTFAVNADGEEVPIAANLTAVGQGEHMFVICVLRRAPKLLVELGLEQA